MLTFSNPYARGMIGLLSIVMIMVVGALIGWSWTMTRLSVIWVIPMSDGSFLPTEWQRVPLVAALTNPANLLSTFIQFGQTVSWASAIMLRVTYNPSEGLTRRVHILIQIGGAFAAVDIVTNMLQMSLNLIATRNLGFLWVFLIAVLIIAPIAVILSQMEEFLLMCVALVSFIISSDEDGAHMRRDMLSNFTEDLSTALPVLAGIGQVEGQQQSQPSSRIRDERRQSQRKRQQGSQRKGGQDRRQDKKKPKRHRGANRPSSQVNRHRPSPRPRPQHTQPVTLIEQDDPHQRMYEDFLTIDGVGPDRAEQMVREVLNGEMPVELMEQQANESD